MKDKIFSRYYNTYLRIIPNMRFLEIVIKFDEDKSLWFYFWNQTKYCHHQSPSSQNNGVVLYQIYFLIVMVEKFKFNRCDFHGSWAHGSRLEIYLPPHWVRLASQICQSRWWTICTHVGVSHNRCGTGRGSLYNRCTLGGRGVAEQNNRIQTGQFWSCQWATASLLII